MSKLVEKVNNDLKQAMKAKNAEKTSVLRMLVAAMRNKEITLRQGGTAQLTEEQALAVVSSEIKKHRDSVEAYAAGGRPELADKESAEIKILEKYLPEQMSDEELEKIIMEIVETHRNASVRETHRNASVQEAPGNASVQKDFGKIMGRVMAKVKGRAEGAKAGELVKKLLAQ